MANMDYLVIEDIHKSFYGVEVLKGVSFSAASGEVHGLLGGNGAGKSTLMNVLGGLYTKDSGRICINGQEVQIHDTKAAERAGIAFIHQELKLFDLRSVAENIMISNLPVKGPFRLIDDKKKNEMAKKYLDEVGLNVEPTTRLGELSIAEQQQVEIAKALSLDAKILIFDEPTRGIDVGAKSEIYHLMNELVAEGKSIIMISSEMTEILRMSDRIVVMCEGKKTGEIDIAEATQENIMHAATLRK